MGTTPQPEHDGQTLAASFGPMQLCLDQLQEIAPVERPQQIIELLPTTATDNRRLILIELIKTDMLIASRAGKHRQLDFYWPACESEIPQSDVPLGLVLEEVRLRRAAGDALQWDDYRDRFPNLADTIGKWLPGNTATATLPIDQGLPELPVGELVDDFYILKLLGKGAFAKVYLARQKSMQRLVALKASQRGSDEPQALSRLDHTNVVRVYDQRQLNEPTVFLLYMQYVAGGTLADCVKSINQHDPARWHGRLLLESIDRNLLEANQSSPEQSSVRQRIENLQWPEVVAWVGVQLSEGLGYAISMDVLHRDVKPANILLSSEGVPKLADFNVSTTDLQLGGRTEEFFGGSLAYMSPEQLQVADPGGTLSPEHLDGRSDLYSLGLTLWELWQGQRPWGGSVAALSLSEAIGAQQAMREQAIVPAQSVRTASERVLENVLRRLLAFDREHRPKSGREAAARFRLALHPQLAHRFEPSPQSLPGRLLAIPVLVIAALIIFGPNTAASIFNYLYNWSRMAELSPSIPQIEEDFVSVANWINGIVFPLGFVLFMAIMLPIRKILINSQKGIAATEPEIDRLWNVGNKATLICGILWAVSGLAFALIFRSMHAEFQLADAFHFFISLVLCGGVAWIYPYFGMTLLSVLVYYPKVIGTTMDDPKLLERCGRLRRHSNWYLLSAAAIPLAGIGLLVFRQNLPRTTVFAGVCITLLGLLAAHFAHRKLEETLQEFRRVL